MFVLSYDNIECRGYINEFSSWEEYDNSYKPCNLIEIAVVETEKEILEECDKLAGEKKFIIMINGSAGDAYITETDNCSGIVKDGFYEQYHKQFPSFEEAEKEYQVLKGPSVWAVFIDRVSGIGFVSEENNFSGNWKGSKYARGTPELNGRFDYYNNYPTKEEAEKSLSEFRDVTIFDKERGCFPWTKEIMEY